MDSVEYEIEITFAVVGDVKREEIVERLFEAFHHTNPDADAIVGVRPDGLIELAYAVETTTPDSAYELGRPIFVSGMDHSGLNLEKDIEAIDILIQRVTSDDGAPDVARELQPA